VIFNLSIQAPSLATDPLKECSWSVVSGSAAHLSGRMLTALKGFRKEQERVTAGCFVMINFRNQL